METRAPYAIIATFVLSVAAAAFMFVYWFTASETGPARQTVLVIFKDSVAGLVAGAGVYFNGIRVGEVTRVYFDVKRPEQAFAEISVESGTPLQVDTRARLNTTLLSGSAAIALNGGKRGSPELTTKPGEALPTIWAEAAGLATISEQVQGTAAKAVKLRDDVNAVAAENRETVVATLNNVQAMFETLARNGPGLTRSIASISDAGAKIGPLGAKLETLGNEAAAIGQAVDPAQVSIITENAAGVMKTVQDNRPQTDMIAANMQALSPRLANLQPKLDKATTDAGRVVAAVDQTKIAHAMDNVTRFRAALDRTAQDREAALSNVDAIGEKLGSTSDRVAAIRKAYAAFIDSDGTRNAFTSVSGAIASIRKTSNNLDKRITEISTAFSRFGGTSSREFKSLGLDAGQTMKDLSRTGRDIQSNPSSVIFGGRPSTLPTYGGP
jgi:phospholipid/cholesterol/gamma-HCH transport system substrate-binding protein